ncbi:MAG TPA: hypothetical protein VLU73_10705, partial [Methylococcaceae bacterium]|nr:hypothetical protein [Methylococcaceae bacterium]
MRLRQLDSTLYRVPTHGYRNEEKVSSRKVYPNAAETLVLGLCQVFAILPVYLFRSVIAKNLDPRLFWWVHN